MCELFEFVFFVPLSNTRFTPNYPVLCFFFVLVGVKVFLFLFLRALYFRRRNYLIFYRVRYFAEKRNKIFVVILWFILFFSWIRHRTMSIFLSFTSVLRHCVLRIVNQTCRRNNNSGLVLLVAVVRRILNDSWHWLTKQNMLVIFWNINCLSTVFRCLGAWSRKTVQTIKC